MALTEEQQNQYDTIKDAMELSEYWNGIGLHMREALMRYVLDGVPVGNFLTALLTNDFMEMCRRADLSNQRKFFDYAMVLANHTPRGCYGSPELHREWIEKGGVRGMLANS